MLFYEIINNGVDEMSFRSNITPDWFFSPNSLISYDMDECSLGLYSSKSNFSLMS